MKFIDLDNSSLGSFGTWTQLDVLTLEAYMLHPTDEVARKEVRTTTGIEFANRYHELLPDDFFRDLFRAASNAKPLKMVHEESRAPFAAGIIAGTLLHHALGTTTAKQKGNSLSYAVKQLSKRFGPGYSAPTIHNLWREFKKVSHYWAAYISAGYPKKGAPTFPCTEDSLPHYLATAKAFSELGQTTRTWKSPKETILHPAECLLLTCSFELPSLASRPPIFFFSKSL
jgi:hypothetical protein